MSRATEGRPWRPDDVRHKAFTVRFRGFDPNEVRGFLNALADHLAQLQERVATLETQDRSLRLNLETEAVANARLRNDLQQASQRPQADAAHDQVTEQAVLLLDQAQQLADQLIDEGMQTARDLTLAVRSHQRETSPGPAAEPAQVLQLVPPSNSAQSEPSTRAREVERIEMMANLAQVQFQAVLDSLNDQVRRLDQDGAENAAPASEAAGPAPSWLDPQPEAGPDPTP